MLYRYTASTCRLLQLIGSFGHKLNGKAMNTPLPPGWESYVDPHGRIYYYNTTTRVSQWNPPYPMQSLPQNYHQNPIIVYQYPPNPTPQNYNQNANLSQELKKHNQRMQQEQYDMQKRAREFAVSLI